MRVTSEELARLKARVAAAFHPSPGSDLSAMLEDCRRVLTATGAFDDVTGRMTGSFQHQLEIECRPLALLAPEAVATLLESAWTEALRYDDFAAHALSVEPGRVVLDVLTAAREAKLYFTGLIVARLD